MNVETLHRISTETQQGRMAFPEVVGQLLGLGVESYFVDLACARKVYYGSDGAFHTDLMILKLDPVAAEFSPSGLIDAIRAAQEGTTRYPEFLQRAAAAGVTAYWAFLTGKRVVYLGRKGELHIEEFPRPAVQE